MARNNNTLPSPLEIRQVANGFIVTTPSFRNGDAIVDEARVFQTMQSLISHLNSHFDHRDNMVLIDPTSTVLR